MSIQPDSAVARGDTNRKVWVINSYHEAYEEEFRGKAYVIPPNGEKKVLMPFLAANRFLGQVTPIPEQLPNGNFKSPPKALQIVELTEEEKLSGDQVKGPDPEEQVSLKCMLCGTQAISEKGLKIHMTKIHPHAEPVKDE